MSRGKRAGLLAIAAVIAVAAFVVLRSGDDDAGDSSKATTPASNEAPSGSSRPRQAEPPPPRATRIRVSAGKPVGGVEDIRAEKGETVRFTITADAPEEVHLHGYDISRPVGPGRPARFRFEAEIEGIFEIELEHSAVPVGNLRVSP